MRPALIVHGGAGSGDAESVSGHIAGCRAALAAGWTVLAHGGSALDAVCAAVQALEDDPRFNAGVGSVLTDTGTVETDASVMDGVALRAGAVGALSGVRHPVRVARALLDDGRHVFLAAGGAHAFAAAHGLELCEADALITERQRRRWQSHAAASGAGTVGAAAVDEQGHVAAATSTGGLSGKLPGRIGDSAVVGAGTYADDTAGAASATGDGEAILRLSLSHAVVQQLRGGADPMRMAGAGIRSLERRVGGRGGIIVVDPFGRVGHARNTAQMVAVFRCGTDPAVVVT